MAGRTKVQPAAAVVQAVRALEQEAAEEEEDSGPQPIAKLEVQNRNMKRKGSPSRGSSLSFAYHN
jgi:hypothetical protein